MPCAIRAFEPVPEIAAVVQVDEIPLAVDESAAMMTVRPGGHHYDICHACNKSCQILPPKAYDARDLHHLEQNIPSTKVQTSTASGVGLHVLQVVTVELGGLSRDHDDKIRLLIVSAPLHSSTPFSNLYCMLICHVSFIPHLVHIPVDVKSCPASIGSPRLAFVCHASMCASMAFALAFKAKHHHSSKQLMSSSSNDCTFGFLRCNATSKVCLPFRIAEIAALHCTGWTKAQLT